jgi:hypothetical protein
MKDINLDGQFRSQIGLRWPGPGLSGLSATRKLA